MSVAGERLIAAARRMLATDKTIAATDAPKGKGSEAVASAAPIQDFAMLKIANGGLFDNGPAPVIGLFSEANAGEARRVRAWIEDRVRRSDREVFSEVALLTPVLAELLLSRNPDNRHIRQSKVDIYATDIRNGDWTLNGETIKISKNGLLNDGQHRCHAVIAASASIKTVFTFGVERASRMTVDQGAARTAGNYLAMGGVENANQVAAVASLIWQVQSFGRIVNSGRDKPTKAQISQTAAEHHDILTSIKAIPSNARIGRSRSVLAFCHYRIVRATSAKNYADSFFLRLVLGEGLTRNDPIYHCRERLLSDQRMTAAERVEIILRTWNAHRKGQKQTKCSPVLGEMPAVER